MIFSKQWKEGKLRINSYKYGGIRTGRSLLIFLKDQQGNQRLDNAQYDGNQPCELDGEPPEVPAAEEQRNEEVRYNDQHGVQDPVIAHRFKNINEFSDKIHSRSPLIFFTIPYFYNCVNIREYTGIIQQRDCGNADAPVLMILLMQRWDDYSFMAAAT
ncbi:MAG TPA: hypothetical protein PK537_05800 [Candidatus Limiplasma sp.]|nr:hypothetical protein [Candidatus Limiplasma sp.]